MLARRLTKKNTAPAIKQRFVWMRNSRRRRGAGHFFIWFFRHFCLWKGQKKPELNGTPEGVNLHWVSSLPASGAATAAAAAVAEEATAAATAPTQFQDLFSSIFFPENFPAPRCEIYLNWFGWKIRMKRLRGKGSVRWRWQGRRRKKMNLPGHNVKGAHIRELKVTHSDF